MPSNYYNVYAEKNTFESEKLSYKILELNTYSSALTLYYTALNDQVSQAIYEEEAADLQKIVNERKERVEFGSDSQQDLQQAQANEEVALVNASQNAELVTQELTQIRSALGLGIDTKLVLGQR